MPIWAVGITPIALAQGIPVKVFDEETLSDNNESIAVAIPQKSSGSPTNITFTLVFGSTPTTVDYRLQLALNNVDAEYYDVSGATITDTAGGKVTVADVNARFARIKAVDADTEEVTAEIMYA